MRSALVLALIWIASPADSASDVSAPPGAVSAAPQEYDLEEIDALVPASQGKPAASRKPAKAQVAPPEAPVPVKRARRSRVKARKLAPPAKAPVAETAEEPAASPASVQSPRAVPLTPAAPDNP